MREIKFRAWDENLKRMFQVHTLGTKFSDTDNLRFGTSTRDFNLMQYTGLKDKNGKEIYEGDILKHDIITFTPFVMEWDNAYCSLSVVGGGQ